MTRWRDVLGRVLIVESIMLSASLALRFGTDISSLGPMWDEPLMQEVVQAIVAEGWTVENALDYQDTKGPAFFWGYAALGELFGTDVGDLRLMTVVIFVITGLPLGVLAALVGLSRGQTAGLTLLYLLLPYNAVLGQMFMSEASFLLGSVCLLLAFVWGLCSDVPWHRRVVGPVVFGVILSLLFYHRIHAVAYAGAAVLVATQRDRERSWPWWVACLLAGLCRLPLYVRWGGFVTPEYQARLGIGLRLDSLTYLAVSLLPCTLVLLWPVLAQRGGRSGWRWVAAASLLGLALGLLAAPDLSLTAQDGKARYLGMVATTLRPLSGTSVLLIVMAVLSAVGVTALAACAFVALKRQPDKPADVMTALAVWSLLVGWGLYALTRGVVFDRYMLPFIVLLPFVWVNRLPRWLLLLQGLGLLVMLGKLAMMRLMS